MSKFLADFKGYTVHTMEEAYMLLEKIEYEIGETINHNNYISGYNKIIRYILIDRGTTRSNIIVIERFDGKKSWYYADEFRLRYTEAMSDHEACYIANLKKTKNSYKIMNKADMDSSCYIPSDMSIIRFIQYEYGRHIDHHNIKLMKSDMTMNEIGTIAKKAHLLGYFCEIADLNTVIIIAKGTVNIYTMQGGLRTTVIK
jgi:hypothetical protein